MYNEDSICVQVMFCNSNFLLNYRKKQRVKTVVFLKHPYFVGVLP